MNRSGVYIYNQWHLYVYSPVPTFDGSHVTVASRVNPIEPLPFIALQTSGDDGGLPLTSSQDEVGRTQKITRTVDQPLQLTHQTDSITASSTTTSQTTTDELDPATEPQIIDFTTAHDELFHTSPTEEILGGDTSTSPHTSRASGHKIPCTPEESQVTRCLNGGECSSVQTSNTSRTLLCGYVCLVWGSFSRMVMIISVFRVCDLRILYKFIHGFGFNWISTCEIKYTYSLGYIPTHINPNDVLDF